VLCATAGIIFLIVYMLFPLEKRISFRTHSAQIKSSTTHAIWLKDRIILGTPNGTAPMFPSSKGVIIWGEIRNQGDHLHELSAMDGSSKVIFQFLEKKYDILYQDRVLYVSDFGGIISAYTETGSKIWTYSTGTNDPLTFLSLQNQTLSLRNDSNGIMVLNAESGEKLYDFFMPCAGFWAVNNHLAMTTCLSNGLELVSAKSFEPQWDTKISTYIDQAPLVTLLPSRSLAIIKSSLPGIHRLFVLDMSDGEKLWETDSNFRSNVILYGNQIIGLTNEGFLKSYNLENGESQFLVSFLPGDFTPKRGDERQFVVEGDTASKRVYVYLGDSLQLFAFEIEP
jgi:outer membrane protein assembly factor BamB